MEIMVLSKEQILEPLEVFLRDELGKEWIAQGHSMTGRALKDIDFVSTVTAQAFSLGIWIPHYSYYLDRGVPAENIPFSGTTGHGGKSKYIQGLINYVEKRMGITEISEAKSVAFAIAHTQKKEGMPTRGSYQYSSTGERTRWFSGVVEQKETLIRQTIYRLVDLVISKNWDTMTTKYINLFRSV